MTSLRRGWSIVSPVYVLLALGCDGPSGTPPAALAPAPPATSASACVSFGPPPPYDGPYPTTAALCAKAPRGQPAPGFTPPTGPTTPEAENAYAAKVQAFLVGTRYRTLGWLGDAHWRLTGPYKGCPPNGENLGVHPAVRIYYSPEVVTWMCNDRRGEIPDGAMIVKEMHSIDSLTVDPKTREMSVPQGMAAGEWTVMIKGARGSADGWYWGDFSPGTGNPPVTNRSAVTFPNFPEHPAKIESAWLPTGKITYGNDSQTGDVVYPNYGFGSYCTNCHASAERESTFSALTNLIGQERRYRHLGADAVPETPAPRLGLHERPDVARKALRKAARRAPSEPPPPVPTISSDGNPFPRPLEQADAAFLKQFPELGDVPFARVWDSRLPAESYDHAVAGAKPGGPDQFVTSDQCQLCHDATQMNGSRPNMAFGPSNAEVNLSPYGEWRASAMGLAGRDPIFFSQLESEVDRTTQEVSLRGKEGCVENMCLHCHGVMGQRQLAIDTKGKGPTDDPCRVFSPPPAKGAPPSPPAGELFSRHLVDAWPGADGANAKYGALARDGVSCAVCHHISGDDLGKESTFTGNFHVGPPGEVYGPFAGPQPKPMQNALGIVPKEAAWVSKSGLCGSCHAINLPVFNNDGRLHGFSYEQTTYLEWLNSDFNDEQVGAKGQSCQACHMPQSLGGRALSFRIANIEDASFPEVEFRLPDPQIALQSRSPFYRHTLTGLNVFLNAYAQQFPLLLGVRQLDFMNTTTSPPLLFARDATLELARTATASLTVDELRTTPEGLAATVTVANLAGHNLPSGVGFRRAFLEFVVQGEGGELLWASGRASNLGVILDGTSTTPLASEFFAGPPGKQAYQEHHQIIRRGDQVQIYEELVQDSDRRFTTSFLHRRYNIKDNRLHPRGYRKDGPFAAHTRPEGAATLADPDYNAPVLSGKDKVRYEVALSPEARKKARSVRVTLYYQATPPYFLQQRFAAAAKGPKQTDTERLYYLASHLDVSAPAPDGKPYLAGWKLAVTTAEQALAPPP